MPALSPINILQIWNQGLTAHPVDRALIILSTALKISHIEAAVFTLGQRNTQLIKIRELTFGNIMECFTCCQQCNERLQFKLDTVLLSQLGAIVEENADRQLQLNEFNFTYRLPNSNDLIEIKEYDNTDDAYLSLLSRIMRKIEYNGQQINLYELPAKIIDDFADCLQTADPFAEILCNLSCSSCKNSWQSAFDIVLLLWNEIASKAKQLLTEVHLLASAYGWDEAAILSLNESHKNFYLNLINK